MHNCGASVPRARRLGRRELLLGIGACAATGLVRGRDAHETSRKLEAVRKLGAELRVTALRISQGGKLLMTDGPQDKPAVIHSMRKPIICALYGKAIAEGVIQLNATLGDLDIEDSPPLNSVEKSATVRDLLEARSGVYLPSRSRMKSVAQFPHPERGAFRPGERWNYNNFDFNVLGNIYERLTHKSFYVAFDHYLAKPLGMQDWDLFRDSYYDYTPDPIGGDGRFPNYRMSLSPRDFTRFGQMYLQTGRWEQMQIVPANWIEESTRTVSKTGWPGMFAGYGYLWWTVAQGTPGTRLPAGTYSAYGSGGSFMTLVPTHQLLVNATIDTNAPNFRPLSVAEQNSLNDAVMQALA